MRSYYIHFKLPKFTIEYRHESDVLIDILKDMGIVTAFDIDRADFLSMYSKRLPDNVCINLVLQNTFIAVDENGTEAAAATVIGIGKGGMPPLQPIEFSCDRPFSYFIMNNNTDELLFAGEYAYVE